MSCSGDRLVMEKKIILIENDRDLAMGLKVLLADFGYQLILPKFPVRIVSLKRYKPQALIVDYLLGGKDGFSLIKELRKKFGYKLPVIMISAIHTHMEKKAKKAGADAFLPKPFEIEKLLEVVNSFPQHIAEAADTVD